MFGGCLNSHKQLNLDNSAGNHMKHEEGTAFNFLLRVNEKFSGCYIYTYISKGGSSRPNICGHI